MVRDDAAMEAWLRERVVGEPQRLPPEGVVLVAYDPSWPAQFEQLAGRIRAALGDDALQIEHIGSTSVPGLSAKPVIDIILGVADSANEALYLEPLEAAGFELRVREPDWYEHRMLRHHDPECNLHVFSAGSAVIEPHLVFRDRLRSNDEDRAHYERTKVELARRPWHYMMQYTDAKTEIVEAIIARAMNAG